MATWKTWTNEPRLLQQRVIRDACHKTHLFMAALGLEKIIHCILDFGFWFRRATRARKAILYI